MGPVHAKFPGPQIGTTMEREMGWTVATGYDFHLTPTDEARVIGSGERLERRLLGRQPRGEVHGWACPARGVRHFSSREQAGEGAVALPSHQAFDARDIDEVDPDANDHGDFRAMSSFSLDTFEPLLATARYTPFATPDA